MVIIIAKKYSQCLSQIISYQWKNSLYEIRYVQTLKALRIVVEEHTTEQEKTPLLVITGRYLYSRTPDGKSDATDPMVRRLRKRDACIVLTVTTDCWNSNLEGLLFSEYQHPIVELLGMVMYEELQQIVAGKDEKRLKELIATVLENAAGVKTS